MRQAIHDGQLDRIRDWVPQAPMTFSPDPGGRPSRAAIQREADVGSTIEPEQEVPHAMEQEVTLLEMLEAREARASRQREIPGQSGLSGGLPSP